MTGASRIARGADNPPVEAGGRKFKIALNPGMIGIRTNLKEMPGLAAQFGFEAIEPAIGELASLSPDALSQLRDDMKAKNVVWSSTTASMPFGRGDEEFKTWLAGF